MKLVSAIIKPFKLDDLKDTLEKLGIGGMTVSEVTGYGRQRGQGTIYRGPEYGVNLVPKLRVDVIVSDDQAEPLFNAIMEVANTGRTGDGKVYIIDLEKVGRIRTGELDEDAV